MIYEFCAENVTLLEKAMQAGARRIELCDNLAVGGTTPSAFDELSDEDQPEAIDWLSQAGVTRILTRAGVSGDSLEKRFVHYHRILEYAKGKIEILPGGGIDLENRQTFIDQVGVTQLHGTKVVF